MGETLIERLEYFLESSKYFYTSPALTGKLLVDCLEALQAMQWREIQSEEDLPKKPGRSSWEQISCVIRHQGDYKLRLWDCKHLCWVSADGSDFYCAPLEPDRYLNLESLPTPKDEKDER